MKKNNSLAWNLKPISKFNRPEIERNVKAFAKKWKGTSEYLEKPEVLARAVGEYEQIQQTHGIGGNELYYSWLRTTQDENDPKIKGAFTQAMDFAHKMEDEMRFFELSLSKLDIKKQEFFLKNKNIFYFKHWLEKIFAQGKHTLSEPEEKILSLKSQGAYLNWVQMVSGFLSKEGRKGRSFNELLSLIDSTNKRERDSAAKAVNEIFAKHIESAEHELNAVLMHKKIDDELRGFARPDGSRHLSDDVDSTVVDAMLDAVESRFDIAQRFYKLKAKMLGVKKLKYHERNIPVETKNEKRKTKNYGWQRSIALVQQVMAGLDPEFADIFDRLIAGGQVDVFPRKGKHGGAFCAHELLSQPTYVLLNHTDKLRDVLTIAHEFGHAINNELMRNKLNALNFGTPTSTAEVASTFMEDFVLQKLLRTADEKERLAIMMNRLNDDISSIFRQGACYRFEQDLHREYRVKGYLSHKDIGALFQKNMRVYMGPAVEQSVGSENWWVYWSHIRNYFYVYSYAGGLLISKSLQASVKQDHAFIPKIKTFLASGMSDSPKNIFAKMGVDISDKTFWQKGLDEVEILLQKTEKLAKK